MAGLNAAPADLVVEERELPAYSALAVSLLTETPLPPKPSVAAADATMGNDDAMMRNDTAEDKLGDSATLATIVGNSVQEMDTVQQDLHLNSFCGVGAEIEFPCHNDDALGEMGDIGGPIHPNDDVADQGQGQDFDGLNFSGVATTFPASEMNNSVNGPLGQDSLEMLEYLEENVTSPIPQKKGAGERALQGKGQDDQPPPSDPKVWTAEDDAHLLSGYNLALQCDVSPDGFFIWDLIMSMHPSFHWRKWQDLQERWTQLQDEDNAKNSPPKKRPSENLQSGDTKRRKTVEE